jgi:hypothetical protein
VTNKLKDPEGGGARSNLAKLRQTWGFRIDFPVSFPCPVIGGAGFDRPISEVQVFFVFG